jgi:hypothetical protein
LARIWSISDEPAAAKPTFAELVADARQTGVFGMTGDALGIFIAQQVGDPRPMDIRHQDGRIMRYATFLMVAGPRNRATGPVWSHPDSGRHRNRPTTRRKLEGFSAPSL